MGPKDGFGNNLVMSPYSLWQPPALQASPILLSSTNISSRLAFVVLGFLYSPNRLSTRPRRYRQSYIRSLVGAIRRAPASLIRVVVWMISAVAVGFTSSGLQAKNKFIIIAMTTSRIP